MARKETDSSKPGRPTEYWSATEDSQTYEINELSPREDDDAGNNLVNSFISSVLDGAPSTDSTRSSTFEVANESGDGLVAGSM